MTGALALVRFHLRRDRLMLLWWIAGTVLLYYSQAVSTDDLYATQADLDRAAKGMESNAAFIAMAGPARALDTVGGQVAWQAAAFGAVVAGLMSMFLVGRHTRAEEESGRDELVRAGVVGRRAPLAAAGIVMALADLVLALAVAGSLVAYGLPLEGSLVLGVACGLTGLVFGAVALVAAQLTDGTRSVYGLTGIVIGAAYVLRAIGDVGNGALSWLSPIGWGQYMRAYAGETWWPALLSVGAAAGLGAVAVVLHDRRDIGAGFWATRPGPARGSMGSSLGLAWRLQRGSVIGWTGGLLVGGLAFGAIGEDVGDLVGDSQLSRDLFAHGGGSLVDSFYGTLAAMLGIIAAAFTISSVLRLRSEEAERFAELLLSTGLSRRRWAASHFVVALGGTVAVLVAAALGLGVGFALVTGDRASGVRFGLAVVSYVAPVLLLGVVTAAAWALRSAWGRVGWAALGFCYVVLLFGTTLRLPTWVVDVSPFQQVALVPAEEFAIGPWLALLALSGVLAGGSVLLLRRRDIG